MRVLLPCGVLVLFAFPALASDGLIEINQACSVETGCLERDLPGFPVTITVREEST